MKIKLISLIIIITAFFIYKQLTDQQKQPSTQSLLPLKESSTQELTAKNLPIKEVSKSNDLPEQQVTLAKDNAPTKEHEPDKLVSIVSLFKQGKESNNLDIAALSFIEDKLYNKGFDELAEQLQVQLNTADCSNGICQIVLSKMSGDKVGMNSDQILSFMTLFEIQEGQEFYFDETDSNYSLYTTVNNNP